MSASKFFEIIANTSTGQQTANINKGLYILCVFFVLFLLSGITEVVEGEEEVVADSTSSAAAGPSRSP